MFSSKLKQASLMHMLGYHDLSLDILLGFENKLVQELLSYCGCKRKHSCSHKSKTLSVNPSLVTFTGSNICKEL